MYPFLRRGPSLEPDLLKLHSIQREEIVKRIIFLGSHRQPEIGQKWPEFPQEEDRIFPHLPVCVLGDFRKLVGQGHYARVGGQRQTQIARMEGYRRSIPIRVRL